MTRHLDEERQATAAGPEQHLPPLNWLRGFEATARTGNFTAAAVALGLTQAAVSYQVRSLEKHLGFPLFERLRHGVRLTEMGRAYLPPVQQAFDEISAATLGLFGATREGSLAIRVPVSFGALWLGPRLPSFRQAYPGIAMRIYSAIWAAAIPAEKVDVEIRIGNGRWPGFTARRIDRSPVIAIGRPGPDAPKQISDLAEASLIEVMGIDDAWTRLFQSRGLPAPRQNRITRVDSSLMALELTAAGLGYALVLQDLAAPFLESGRVVDLFGIRREPRQSHYLLQPIEAGRQKPEARLFEQWLFREVEAIGMLEGRGIEA